MSEGVRVQVCELAAGVCLHPALLPCVSVCLAALFLILGVDILEDKGADIT